MASIINTNISSLTAQRNLSMSQSSLATSMQRLSSGLRINSAKDDAAGLAISERMSSQIRGMNQAVRNANDGISLAQTAEGSLGEVGNNLQRIRELAVQSANATNSSSDRTALNAEVTQLVSEIDRVSKQADFNGTKLLDGSFSSQLFQVGANAGQTIGINKIANTTAAALGGAQFDSNTVTVAAPADGNTDVKISGFKITDSLGTVTMGTKQFADAIDVSTVKGAQQALEIVDKALESVNSVRADLGAIQNRFTSVVANLQTSSENLSASRSRIRDTDFAKETAELTRTQILQQAGTAMLAQANQVPQNVLSLLQR